MPEPFPPPNYQRLESTVEGIEVYAPRPVQIAAEAEVMNFNCPNCGATTAYSVNDRGVTCRHCGFFEAPQGSPLGRNAEQLEFTVATMERAAQGWGVARKEICCENCGGSASLPEDSLTFTCAFCGSNKVIQRQAAQDILRPRFVAPFEIDTARCTAAARSWLGSSWMVPADLRSGAKLADFSGIYLPYWTFDANTHAAWKAEVGYTHTERYRDNGEWKQRTVTDWRWESGEVNLPIDDLLIPGTRRVSMNLLSQIESFNLGALAPFEPKYLAGYLAQAYDTPLEIAWDAGRRVMREKTREACHSQAGSSQIRNFSMELDFADESWRYILLPVYLSAYSYAGKTYQAVLNGQSGAIAGQRPVDWNRVWLVIALLLSPGALLGLFGLLTLPFAGIGIVIGGVGFILLIVGVIISITFYVQADRMDDL